MGLNPRDNDRYWIGRRTLLKSTAATGGLAGGLPHLSTSAAAASSVLTFDDLEGRPSGYERGEELGTFIWKSGDRIQVRMDNEGGDVEPARVFAFSFTTDGSFTDLQYHNWNGVDQIEISDSSIEGRNRVSHFSDGFSFKLQNASQITINAEIGDGHSEFNDKSEIIEDANTSKIPHLVYFGTERINPTSLPTEIVSEIPQSFEDAKDLKIKLASRITTVSSNISEKERVSATLKQLTTAVNEGSVSSSDAKEAVQRMFEGEEITETLLMGLSPDYTDEFDTAGRVVDFATEAVITVMLAGVAVGRVAKWAGFGKVGKSIGKARSKLDAWVGKFVDTVTSGLSKISNRIQNKATSVSSFLENLIKESGITSGAELAQQSTNKITGWRDNTARFFISLFEQNYLFTDINDKLEELDDTFDSDQNGPELGGTLDGAKNASDQAISDVTETLENAQDEMKKIESRFGLVQLLGLIATVLVASFWGSLIGAVAALVAALFSVVTALGGAGAGVSYMSLAMGKHHEGINGVIKGSVTDGQ